MEIQKEILLKENFKLKELKMGCGNPIYHSGGYGQSVVTYCDNILQCRGCEEEMVRQEGRIEGIKFMLRKIKSSKRKKSEGRTGGRRSAS